MLQIFYFICLGNYLGYVKNISFADKQQVFNGHERNCKSKAATICVGDHKKQSLKKKMKGMNSLVLLNEGFTRIIK